MDAVLRNFKTIPCPVGDRCSNPSCQWQHSWEQKTASHGLDGAGDQDDGGPRKRRKISSDAVQNTTTEVMTAKKAVSPPPLKRKSHPLPSTLSDSSHKYPGPANDSRQSTPAKRDSVPIPSSVQVTAPKITPLKVTPVKATPTPVTTPKPTSVEVTPAKVVAPRKVESLNPRHLKSAAPAAHDFRYKALKMLHDQFVWLNNELKKDAKEDEKKLVLSPQELIWMALDEEEKMATDKPAIYNNIIKNRIMNYKRMTPGQWRDERVAEQKKKQATDKKPVPKSGLGPPKEINTGLTPHQEMEFLPHLLTPITTLSQFGYVPTVPSDADIAKAREGQEASFGWEVCDRCTSRFQVFPGRREEDGALTSGGKCTYHWGKVYFPDRVPGSMNKQPKRYRCCGQAVGDTSGCITGDTHVFKANAPARLATVVPFAKTPPNPLAPKDRAVCFDCEMGYTVRGLELLRLTATSWPDGKELLDVLVHPVGEILDLNSRFSGVWPEDVLNAEPWSANPKPDKEDKQDTKDGNDVDDSDDTRPKKKKMQIVSSPVVARDLLFSLISPETPLIGHGLENDLNAVRVVHPTLIDTILLYPHPRGLPIRNGLKMLMMSRLNKVIQVEAKAGERAVGHDSAEDARAAGELVRLKVQDKWKAMKEQGWTLVDGVFVPPPGKRNMAGSLSEKFLEEGEVE
ncbi:hypothetical protein B0H66DRAFT_573554 [Apodospora peruviana]|uniref:Exonuclease domain-containing protein n=1 Tax=Apodospora peruviana TaxID=516989 RepID=A0AAE0IIU6_9PEZI|nr:hypothetical protein B0H66DRAFT_573554 [Apodospora peruviana]